MAANQAYEEAMDDGKFCVKIGHDVITRLQHFCTTSDHPAQSTPASSSIYRTRNCNRLHEYSSNSNRLGGFTTTSSVMPPPQQRQPRGVETRRSHCVDSSTSGHLHSPCSNSPRCCDRCYRSSIKCMMNLAITNDPFPHTVRYY